MESLAYLLHGFETALSGWNLLYALIGVSFGMFVGVLPGLGPTAGTALLLPLTYGMEPVSAVIMLSGIYYGAMYGGTITSVLINVPGESASLITCMDGYPMARQGRAGTALGVAAIGSFIGGMIALAILIFVGPLVASQALKFGPPEYFALVVVGLSLLIGLMGKSLVRGMIAALFGLTLAFVGMDPLTGSIRFAFGQESLEDGIEFVALAMGLFGLSEIFMTAEENLNQQAAEIPKIQNMIPRREEWGPSLKAILRGSGIGVLLGLVPGTNSVIPTILSYSIEQKTADDPSPVRQRRHRRCCRTGNRQQRLRWRCSDSAFYPGYSQLAVHRRSVRCIHHARPDARTDADAKKSGIRLGRNRQHVHRQCHAAGHEPAARQHVGATDQGAVQDHAAQHHDHHDHWRVQHQQQPV